MAVVLISATRLAEQEFWTHAALGQSLRRLSFDRRLAARIAFANQRGLPEIYNLGMAECADDDAVCFIHDDVWIDDHHFLTRVLEGLAVYDVIGVAGNRRRQPRQPSWAFVDDSFKWDEQEFLSGAVAHGPQPCGAVSWFGEAPIECELLDGVLLAVLSRTLKERQLRFDDGFRFHFYDLDFCRSARSLGLRLGTWPISLTHQSGGSYGTQAWREGYERYQQKWGD